MIGDDVNDAPVLKMADVGVAMGDMGSDLAMEQPTLRRSGRLVTISTDKAYSVMPINILLVAETRFKIKLTGVLLF